MSTESATEIPTCQICDRAEGSTIDRCGNEDGSPLGAIERCPTCGRLACPDCRHEADCCFVEIDRREVERGLLVRWWAKVSDTEYQMVATRGSDREGGLGEG